MELLREYVRLLLTESAKTVDDLPPGVFVQITEDDDSIIAKFVNRSNKSIGIMSSGIPFGVVECDKIDTSDFMIGATLDAYEVTQSRAKKGWGPLLYDAVMESVGKAGFGLTCDRYSVSDEAFRVWTHYLLQRPDVQSKQLDFGPGYETHLTSTKFDDSNMPDRFLPGLENKDPAIRKQAQQEYLQGPLSKVYYATGTSTLDRLRATGRLIEI